MRLLRLLSAALLLLPASAAAQESDGVMQSMREMYEAGKGYVTATAEQSSAEDFAYRPTEGVRTLGQVLAHLADTHFVVCSIALGEPNPNASSVERAGLERAELIGMLNRSYEYCDRAYAQSQQVLSAPAELFGRQSTRFHALNLNVNHDYEHYGNLVTYVRMLGRVPPSSQ